jgi:hypothetical protein
MAIGPESFSSRLPYSFLVDWNAALSAESDARFTVSPDCVPERPPLGSGLCVTFNGPEGAGSDGEVALPLMREGDLAGDGGIEAVVPVQSADGAGTIGFLVYRLDGARGPTARLVDVRSGFDPATISVEDGKLVVESLRYAPADRECCPSRSTFARYRLVDDALRLVSEQTVSIAIRWADWDAVISADRRLTVDPELCIPGKAVGFAMPGTCISVEPFGSDPPTSSVDGQGTATIRGYVEPARWGHYADIDGDGIEEAVLRVETGGPGGMVGFLVYYQADPAPRLVAAVATYRGGLAEMDGTSIVLTRPLLDAYGLNAIPSRFDRATYVLRGDIVTRTSIEPFP